MSDLENKVVFSERGGVEVGCNFLMKVGVIVEYKERGVISVESGVDGSLSRRMGMYEKDGR